MYRVIVDLCITYSPPMNSHGSPIRLTREFELPFPPYDGLAVFSRDFDSAPEPPGFVLKNVSWDLDRQLFIAETFFVSTLPMAEIADDLVEWLQLGWRWGSFKDHYETDDDEWDEVQEGEVEDFDDEIERWPSVPSRQRPREFNKLMRALVRTMAELYNDESVA